jgi:allantoin racemase
MVRESTELSETGLLAGPASVESAYEEALAIPDILARLVEAQRDGVDAAVIDGVLSPGLAAGREIVEIPVVGAGQAAVHVAGMLADSFSLVTVLSRVRRLIEDAVSSYGLASRLRSVRAVDMTVLELATNRDHLVRRLVEESIAAVTDDDAKAIILGCSGMYGCADALSAELAAHGYADVPVIDPVLAAIKVAELLVELGLTQSKRSYPRPPAKELSGFPFLCDAAAGVGVTSP